MRLFSLLLKIMKKHLVNRKLPRLSEHVFLHSLKILQFRDLDSLTLKSYLIGGPKTANILSSKKLATYVVATQDHHNNRNSAIQLLI